MPVWELTEGSRNFAGKWDHLVPSTARSVFWDLYCAAPDRREACDHASEAKVFQDYVSLQDSGIWATSFVFVYFFYYFRDRVSL